MRNCLVTMRMLGMTLTALLWMAGSVNARASTVTYVYTDPQGTPLAEADASGNITARFEYTPYGAPVTSMGAAPDGVGYTGHVNDPETGLVYMQARYYDAEVGRFLSVDPVRVEAGDGFGFNRYTYVKNNPLGGVDPTGMFAKNLSGDQIDCEIYSGSGCGTSGSENQINKNITPFMDTSTSVPSRQQIQKESKIPSTFKLYGSYKDADCRKCYDVWMYQLTNAVGVALTGEGYAVEEHITQIGGRPGPKSTSEGIYMSLRDGIGYDKVGLTPLSYAQLTKADQWSATYRQTFTVSYQGRNYELSTVFVHQIIVSNLNVTTSTVVLRP